MPVELAISELTGALPAITPDGFPAGLGAAPDPAPDNLSHAPGAFTVDVSALLDEGGTDPVFGTVTWRTLISADRLPSSGLVAGVAQFGPGGTLRAHRHSPVELYFGLSGDGVVTVEGVEHRIGAGIALFVPGDAEHGVVAGAEGLSFLYSFPADRFDEVVYRFSEAAGDRAAGALAALT